MNDSDKKTMPICFTPDQLKLIESYAKKKGMFNPSQAIEDIIERSWSFSKFVKLSQTGINKF
jgi:hypothetical protein